jgi:hypothetical protein
MGVFFEIHGRKYFLQALLISHVFDTKGLGSEFHVQEVGSHNGCPFCDASTGVRREETSSTVYPALRNKLPINHR